MRNSMKLIPVCAVLIIALVAITPGASLAAGGDSAGAPGAAGNNPPAANNPAASNPAPAAPFTQHNNVDDATLKQTARAFVKVREINQKEQPALNSATNEDAKQQVMQQAESEKLAAVKGEGLQPEEYNRVIRLVQVDDQLRQRFISFVNESQPARTM